MITSGLVNKPVQRYLEYLLGSTSMQLITYMGHQIRDTRYVTKLAKDFTMVMIKHNDEFYVTVYGVIQTHVPTSNEL